jgi:hypothetical protein
MRIFIDTEFNDFRGELISMALVAEDGHDFYGVLECSNPTPWVEKNVLPVLYQDPVPEYLFKAKLFEFLSWFDHIHLVADWPEDIQHFCQAIITGPGEMMNIPSFTCEVRRDLDTNGSKVPHNALEDAKALYECFLTSSF